MPRRVPFRFVSRLNAACLWTCFCLASLAGPLSAGDWPQLLGPSRDSRTASDEPAPEGLPGKLVASWKLECGEGYAGPAVAGDSVYIFDRVANQERVRRVGKQDGQVRWTQQWPATYSGGVDRDRGPRCVPTVTDKFVIAFGAAGQLVALDKESGAVAWSRPLRSEYQADDGYFGAGSSPLVIDQAIIVNVGGKKSAGTIAVNLQDGKTMWETKGYEASYASPIAIRTGTAGGTQSQLALVPSRLTTYALDLKSGKVVFEFPFGARGPTVNAATPVQLDNGQVFLNASYGIGSYLIQPKQDGFDSIYANEMLLSSQYSSPVAYRDVLFASDGREDQGTGQLKCVDVLKKKVLWDSEKVGVAHLIGFANSVLAVGIDGKLVLFEANREQFKPIGMSALPSALYRALPAYSDGTLYLKSSDPGQGSLVAVKLR